MISMATVHIDEIKALARQAHDDPAVRERLVADVLGADRGAAVQAAWALTHLPKADNERLAAHRKALSLKALATDDTSLRRLTLALLERMPWSAPARPDDEPPEHYLRLLDFCLEHMMLADESYGVRALCMKLAYRLSLPYPELLGELRRSLLLLEPSELGAGVRCTRKNLLKILTP